MLSISLTSNHDALTLCKFLQFLFTGDYGKEYRNIWKGVRILIHHRWQDGLENGEVLVRFPEERQGISLLQSFQTDMGPINRHKGDYFLGGKAAKAQSLNLAVEVKKIWSCTSTTL